MKMHIALATLVATSVTLTSCAPEKSSKQTVKGGRVYHLEDLQTRGSSSKDAFDKVTRENSLVVVDFYADWCGPCKRLAPGFAALAKQKTNIVFVKVNTDKHQDLMRNMGVRGIPALFFFKDGKRVHKTTGYLSQSDLEREINKAF